MTAARTDAQSNTTGHRIEKPRNPMHTNASSVTGLRSWLIERVAGYLGREPIDIDPDVPLAAVGLDSVYAFALCGDIEDTFRTLVDPALVRDLRTVNGLAAHLCGTMEAAVS
jgi:acyl carrier protein